LGIRPERPDLAAGFSEGGEWRKGEGRIATKRLGLENGVGEWRKERRHEHMKKTGEEGGGERRDGKSKECDII